MVLVTLRIYSLGNTDSRVPSLCKLPSPVLEYILEGSAGSILGIYLGGSLGTGIGIGSGSSRSMYGMGSMS